MSVILLLSASCDDTLYTKEIGFEPEEIIENPDYRYVESVWRGSCSGSNCHFGGGQAEGLLLDAGYDFVVNVPSSQLPELDLIEPGSDDESYLFLKLTGEHLDVGGAGNRMPLAGEVLTDIQLENIRGWILNDAPKRVPQ